MAVGRRILNENDSHSETLAGARVPGSAGLVKSFLQIFFLTFALEYASAWWTQAQKNPHVKTCGLKILPNFLLFFTSHTDRWKCNISFGRAP